MSNLLQETIATLRRNGYNYEDVEWVGTEGGEYAMSWEEFANIADFEYNSSYECVEIPTALVVVGKNWWLSRDGSEWWIFNRKPRKNRKAQPFKINNDEIVGVDDE